jgi:cell division protein FtsL
MRQFSGYGTMPGGTKKPILKKPPGTRIQKKGYGTVEKVLLALVAVSFLIIAALSIPW